MDRERVVYNYGHQGTARPVRKRPRIQQDYHNSYESGADPRSRPQGSHDIPGAPPPPTLSRHHSSDSNSSGRTSPRSRPQIPPVSPTTPIRRLPPPPPSISGRNESSGRRSQSPHQRSPVRSEDPRLVRGANTNQDRDRHLNRHHSGGSSSNVQKTSNISATSFRVPLPTEPLPSSILRYDIGEDDDDDAASCATMDTTVTRPVIRAIRKSTVETNVDKSNSRSNENSVTSQKSSDETSKDISNTLRLPVSIDIDDDDDDNISIATIGTLATVASSPATNKSADYLVRVDTLKPPQTTVPASRKRSLSGESTVSTVIAPRNLQQKQKTESKPSRHLLKNLLDKVLLKSDSSLSKASSSSSSGNNSLNTKAKEDTRPNNVTSSKPSTDKGKSTCTVAGKPGLPEAIDWSANHVELEWTAPTSDGGSPIEGYVIEKRDTSSSLWEKAAETTGPTCKAVVHGLVENQEYQYRIFSLNKVGLSEPSNLSKPITAKPRFLKPKIINPPSLEDLKLSAGRIMKFDIDMVGEPPPTIVWNVNGSPLVAGNAVELDNSDYNSKLAIRPATRKNSGRYTITITNSSGKDSWTINVVILDKPAKPEGPLEVSDVTKSGCKLEWKKPEDDGGTPIKHYEVEKLDALTGQWISCGRSEETEFNVEGLMEGKSYKFRVKCANKEGLSEELEMDKSIIAKNAYVTTPSNSEAQDVTTSSNSVTQDVTTSSNSVTPDVTTANNHKEKDTVSAASTATEQDVAPVSNIGEQDATSTASTATEQDVAPVSNIGEQDTASTVSIATEQDVAPASNIGEQDTTSTASIAAEQDVAAVANNDVQIVTIEDNTEEQGATTLVSTDDGTTTVDISPATAASSRNDNAPEVQTCSASADTSSGTTTVAQEYPVLQIHDLPEEPDFPMVTIRTDVFSSASSEGEQSPKAVEMTEEEKLSSEIKSLKSKLFNELSKKFEEIQGVIDRDSTSNSSSGSEAFRGQLKELLDTTTKQWQILDEANVELCLLEKKEKPSSTVPSQDVLKSITIEQMAEYLKSLVLIDSVQNDPNYKTESRDTLSFLAYRILRILHYHYNEKQIRGGEVAGILSVDAMSKTLQNETEPQWTTANVSRVWDRVRLFKDTQENDDIHIRGITWDHEKVGSTDILKRVRTIVRQIQKSKPQTSSPGLPSNAGLATSATVAATIHHHSNTNRLSPITPPSPLASSNLQQYASVPANIPRQVFHATLMHRAVQNQSVQRFPNPVEQGGSTSSLGQSSSNSYRQQNVHISQPLSNFPNYQQQHGQHPYATSRQHRFPPTNQGQVQVQVSQHHTPQVAPHVRRHLTESVLWSQSELQQHAKSVQPQHGQQQSQNNWTPQQRVQMHQQFQQQQLQQHLLQQQQQQQLLQQQQIMQHQQRQVMQQRMPSQSVPNQVIRQHGPTMLQPAQRPRPLSADSSAPVSSSCIVNSLQQPQTRYIQAPSSSSVILRRLATPPNQSGQSSPSLTNHPSTVAESQSVVTGSNDDVNLLYQILRE